MPKFEDERFKPPAPVASVSFTNPKNEKSVVDVLLLIDTGADISVVPESLVSDLEAENLPGAKYKTISFDGAIGHHRAVDLEMNFLGKRFRGRFIVVSDDEGVIGRNILNTMKFVYDGPNEEWYEMEE